MEAFFLIRKFYNLKKGVSPQPLLKKKDSELVRNLNPYKFTKPNSKPIIDSSSVEHLQKMVKKTKKEMEKMAKNLNFMEAARLRDELQELQDELKKKA